MRRLHRPGPVFSLWILISLGLIIYVLIAFTDNLHIGFYEPAKGSFKDILLAHEEPEKIIIESDSIPEIKQDSVLRPDTTVRKVFVFGDSMAHYLAMSIAKYGSKNNYKVTSVTWESSSIVSWAKSDKIENYLKEINPDFIFISLGSNDVGLKDFSKRENDVRKILKKLGNREFIWVGPPLWKKDKGIYDMLARNIDTLRIFKFKDIKIQRAPDHIHPTKKGADTWADTLMRWQLNSAHPIPAEYPDSGYNPKDHKFIYLHLHD